MKNYCPYCGCYLKKKTDICKRCGAALNFSEEKTKIIQYENENTLKENKKEKFMISIILVLLFLVVILIFILLFLLLRNKHGV